MKTDQEPAILEVKREAGKLAREEGGIEIVPEESQAYVSPTNGIAEQAIQAIERKVRTLKFSVEQLHGVKLPPNHPLLVWAVEYAGQIESRTHRYTGVGRTAFELRRGKPYKRKLPPFGEKVMALTLGKKKMKSEYRAFDAVIVALESGQICLLSSTSTVRTELLLSSGFRPSCVRTQPWLKRSGACLGDRKSLSQILQRSP